jgi:WD40 repeat protein
MPCVSFTLTFLLCQILASSSYDDTVKLYACDYATDDWSMTHSLPPAPPKHYHFPGAAEPGPDESGTGHTSTVWASSFSPCGQYIASCSDDLTIKIWAKYKKENSGDGGGAFRVGRTEKEGWTCLSTLKGYHDRTIFSVDWTEAGNWTPSNLKDGEVVLGRLASAGGDGKLCVIGLSTTPVHDGKNGGVQIHHTPLASVEQAHGVHDLNHVQWCRLGKEAEPQAAASVEDESGDGLDEDTYKPDANKTWKEARNMLATAGDDGDVHIWRFGPCTTATSSSINGNTAGHDTVMQTENA